MSEIRIPLRPLSRVLAARARGENPDNIERANIRARHDHLRDTLRQRAETRLLMLAVVFSVLFGTVALRMGALA
ncbi:MAG: cell division protein FtsI, partial [Alphaproteobacteria bacterium HGW-Alphaproteobacteria-2]